MNGDFGRQSILGLCELKKDGVRLFMLCNIKSILVLKKLGQSLIAKSVMECCRACCEKCFRNHHTRHEFTHGSSFFKVMGAEFSSYLEIPSECSEQIQIKDCRDAILEGPSGYLWHVRIYGSGTSAFFKDGWEIFVSDHLIQPNNIIVFRHVKDVHFLVQIFESSGYEKQSSFTVKNSESCHLNKRGMSTICNHNSYIDKKNITEKSIFEQERPTRNPLISDVENTKKRFIQGTGLKVHITETRVETSIPNCKSFSPKNRELLDHCKVSVKNASRVQNLKWNSENQVGLCAKQPIILDSEDEPDSQASPAYSHDQDTIVYCHSGSEKFQEKLSSRGDICPDMQVKDLKASNSVKRNKPKLSLVMKKTAVAAPFWLGWPKSFGRCWFPQGRVGVLLSCQSGKWPVTFIGDRRSCGLGPGWKYFAKDNELNIGDACIFELEDAVNHIFKVHIERQIKEEGKSKRIVLKGRSGRRNSDRKPSLEYEIYLDYSE